jgi:hypothetical protein
VLEANGQSKNDMGRTRFVSWCSAIFQSIPAWIYVQSNIGRATRSLIEDAHCTIGVGTFDLQLLCEM